MDVQSISISQYRAALRMTRSAVTACPESLWTDGSFKNRFWHVAYHTLHYAHLYLGRSVETFVSWERARPEYQYLGRVPWPPHAEPKIGEPYGKDEILELGELVAAMVAQQVRGIPLDEPSGFPWLPFSRGELHVYNIRHIQHHTGQLIDRIRERCGTGVEWIGMEQEEP